MVVPVIAVLEASLLAQALAPVNYETSSRAELSPSAPREGFDAKEAEFSCGPRALFIWLRLLGHDVEYDEVVQRVPVGSEGTSLAQLADGARHWTRTARLVSADPNDLERLPLPLIAHGWLHGEPGKSGHYVVVVTVTPDAVVCLDAGRGLELVVPRDQFKTFWSGYLLTRDDRLAAWNRYLAVVSGAIAGLIGIRVLCRKWRPRSHAATFLLIASTMTICACGHLSTPDTASLEPNAARASPLTCSATELNVGVVPLGRSASAVFQLRNATGKPVQLSLGRPTCQCLSARLGKERVGPNESVNLTLVLSEAADGAGKRQGSVAVGVVGFDGHLFLRASGLLEGMRTDPYTLRLPANLAAFSPPPIRGEILLGRSQPEPVVRIEEAVLYDPVAVRDAAALKDPGPRSIKLGQPLLESVEQVDAHLRRRFSIPVTLANATQAEPGMFDLRIRYRIGDRTADHHLRVPMFREAQVPLRTKAP